MTVVQREESVASAYARRSCPACGSSDSSPGVSARTPAETRGFDELSKHWYGFFKERIFFSYRRCDRCGLLFAPTYFGQDQLELLYSSMPANMEQVADAALERTQRGYFEELRRVAPMRGQLLEIGPDVGLFARHCAREGQFTKFWMFEPNVDAHERLHRNTAPVETYVSTALLNLSEVPERSIDVAAMIHVLDHIVEPVAFLRQLAPKLARDGVLFIVTHDERSAMARVTKGRWPAYCLQHPHLFNRGSMAQLLASGGLKLTKTVRSTNYFPVTFLLEQAALVAGQELRFPRLPALQLPLRLGNFISLAQKA